MTEASDFKEIVKQQADIVRVVGDYVKLRKAGAQNYSGLCPFHGEKTPSFSVHATRQFFHCFGCGVSGDVFAFVQKIENITFPEAVRAIAQKLGIAMPKASYSSPVEAQEARMRTVLLEVHERACGFFQECLRRPEGAHAREYLAGRGLDEETIKAFRIGYAPDSGFLLKDRLKGEFPEEVLRESGLFSWKENTEIPPGLKPARNDRGEETRDGKVLEDQDVNNGGGEQSSPTTNDQRPTAALKPTTNDQRPTAAVGPTAAAMYSKFRNRVLFPIANETGRVIAFTGRTLATDEKAGPKYLNSPETPIYSKSRVLFNLDHAKEAIRKLDYAILVEGQMDCIAVFAAGFHNVIASSGTAFTELQAKLLGRFSKNVVVNFDPDTAGAKATERTLGLLIEEEFQIKVLTLETGFDPDLFIRRKGKDAYAAELKKSQKYFDYLIERARAQFSTRSAETKVKAVNYLLPHIQRVPSRIVRDELAQEIAQRLGIDSSVLRQELKHAAGSRATATVKASAEAQMTDAERILVRALASARELLTSEHHLSGRDGAEEDFDPARQAHFVLKTERFHIGLTSESLVEVFLNAGDDSADVMQLPMSDGDRRLLASVLMSEHEELTAELLEEAVSALRRRQLEQRQRVIKTLIANAEHSKDLPTLTRLVKEKQEIDQALAS
jgi:DNA primase